MGVHGLSLLLADRLVGVHSSLNSPTLKATPTYTSKILHDPVQGESAEPVTAKAFLCAVRDLGWQYCQQECRGQPGGEAAIARTKRGPREDQERTKMHLVGEVKSEACPGHPGRHG